MAMRRSKRVCETDSVFLTLSNDEYIKADHILKEGKQRFPDVNITLEDTEIIFAGINYENLLECKDWFKVEIGQVMPNRRRPHTARSRSPNVHDATLGRHKYTEYITYEKRTVRVVEGDLLSFDKVIDCYVNTTNTRLDDYSSVAKLLKDKCGTPYQTECEKLKQKESTLTTTQCLITTAGNLSAKNVIHAFCPNQADYTFSKKKMEEDVFSTVFNCLKMAEEHKLQSIAFPFLCTGHGQLGIKICSQQYAFAILEFSRLMKTESLGIIYFIDIDKLKQVTVNKMFLEILPSKEMQLLKFPTQDFSEDSMPAENSEDSVLVDHSSKTIGAYSLIFEKGDIRSSDAVAIVCPENLKAERGGLLAAAIKCAFRKSFDPRKLSKLANDAIATTEHRNESGRTQYILHVQTTVWEKNCNEKEFENNLKHTIDMIFEKLKRHKKRNIRSLAIPLMGIESVEHVEVVGNCCKWQSEKIVEVLQGTEEIPNLQEVRFINRCGKITNSLLTKTTKVLSMLKL